VLHDLALGSPKQRLSFLDELASRRFHEERIFVEVEVTLRLTVSQSICLGIKYPCGTCDQILLPVAMLLSEICGLVSMGRPL
jgi:hypothetical protein